MKYEPITQPKNTGHNGWFLPKVVLDENDTIHGSVNFIHFNISNLDDTKNNYLDLIDGESLRDVIDRYRDRIEKEDYILIDMMNGLHGEMYELNKNDGKWYLVKQGRGWG